MEQASSLNPNNVNTIIELYTIYLQVYTIDEMMASVSSDSEGVIHSYRLP